MSSDEKALQVADGYLVVPAELGPEDMERTAKEWDRAVLEGKKIILGGGTRFVAWSDVEAARIHARRYLARLERLDHPDAERDPVGALGQVAVDLKQALLLRPAPAAEKAVRIALMTGDGAAEHGNRDEVVLHPGQERTVQVEVESEGIGQDVRVLFVGFEAGA